MFEQFDRNNGLANFNQALNAAKASNEKYNDVVTFLDADNKLVQDGLAHKDGLMGGIPVALKDNVCTKDVKTTACCNILNNYIPQYNAAIVDKLVNAGALITVKSNMDELAMGGTNLTSNIGACLNPYDTTRISGGSSGGSAVLVADGTFAMAIGSDTGDSVRKPAAYCGCIGVKPTYGRISRYGIIPYSSSLDHVGYFTQTVKDAAITLQVLAGRDDRDMTSSYEPVPNYSELLNSDVNGKTFGVVKNVVDAIDNQDILDQFNQLLENLKQKGAIIKEVSYQESAIKALLPAYYIIANCEASANHSNLDGLRFGVQVEGSDPNEVMMNSRTAGLGPLIRKRFVIGSYGLFQENQERLFKKAQKVRRVIVDQTMAMFDSVDGIIAPAAPTIASKIDNKNSDQLSDNYLVADNWLSVGNFAGIPSITVPLGFSDGCPIATNIMTKPFSEQLMFDLAAGVELASNFMEKKGANR